MDKAMILRVGLVVLVFVVFYMYGRATRRKNEEIVIVDFEDVEEGDSAKMVVADPSGKVVSLRDWKRANTPPLTDEEIALTIQCDKKVAEWLEKLREAGGLPHVRHVIRRALKEYEWRLAQTRAGHQHALIKKLKKE